MASSDKCPLFNAKAQAERQARQTRWEWEVEKKDQTQSPPAYARATNTPVQKPPTLEDLVSQIKNLSHEDSDKLLEKIITTEPKEREAMIRRTRVFRRPTPYDLGEGLTNQFHVYTMEISNTHPIII
jgi:hypothetical protein